MKRILAYPRIYNLYQSLIGANAYLRCFSEAFIKTEKGSRILDMGCGTANIVSFFSSEIEYIGIDFSQKYIDYASKKYAKQTFLCCNICEKNQLNGTFDIVISKGVMAGLTDEQLLKMFDVIVSLSDKKTRIILSDMNYHKNASFLEKFFECHERNKELRSKDDYVKLIGKKFNIDKITELNNVYRIPYSRIVFECTIKD